MSFFFNSCVGFFITYHFTFSLFLYLFVHNPVFQIGKDIKKIYMFALPLFRFLLFNFRRTSLLFFTFPLLFTSYFFHLFVIILLKKLPILFLIIHNFISGITLVIFNFSFLASIFPAHNHSLSVIVLLFTRFLLNPKKEVNMKS